MELSYIVNHDTDPVVSTPYHFGKGIPIDLNFDTGAKTHHAFGGICAGLDDTLYVVFRAGYAHGADSQGNVSGDIYYAKSTDYGKTWGDAVLFLKAPTGRDYRDATLSYDPIYNMYYLIYTDVSVDYDNGTRELHILRGATPFLNMVDITPSPRPLDFMCQTFHTVERNGSYLYLTYYGKNTGDTTWRAGIMRSTAGNNWTNVKTWEADGDNECSVFFSYDDTNEKQRINVLFRAGNDMARLSYSDDGGATWSPKQDLGFDAAGGLRVFDINDMYMLVARDQSNSATHSFGYALFSKDGINWSKRVRIANVGPVYPTITRTRNGRTYMLYSEEYGVYARLFLKEIHSVPTL